MNNDEYTTETYEDIVNGKLCRITVRANRPSEQALKNYLNKMIEIYNDIQKRKKEVELLHFFLLIGGNDNGMYL